jgi:uncharacterized protein
MTTLILTTPFLLLSLLLLPPTGAAPDAQRSRNGHLNPERDYKETPEKLKLSVKEFQLTTPDKSRLNTWLFFPDSVKRYKPATVILVGSGGGNMSHLIAEAAALKNYGYNVYTFDYRGYGKSSNFTFKRNQLYYDEFVTDLKTVIDTARKMYPNNKIGLWSFSIGAPVALLAGETAKVDFQIMEGVSPNPKQMAERLKKKYGRDVSVPASGSKIETLIKTNPARQMLIIGKKDDLVPETETRDLIGKSISQKILFYDGTHAEGFAKLGDAYIKDIDAFIKKIN